MKSLEHYNIDFLSKFSAAFFQTELDVPRNVKGESNHY